LGAGYRQGGATEDGMHEFIEPVILFR